MVLIQWSCWMFDCRLLRVICLNQRCIATNTLFLCNTMRRCRARSPRDAVPGRVMNTQKLCAWNMFVTQLMLQSRVRLSPFLAALLKRLSTRSTNIRPGNSCECISIVVGIDNVVVCLFFCQKKFGLTAYTEQDVTHLRYSWMKPNGPRSRDLSYRSTSHYTASIFQRMLFGKFLLLQSRRRRSPNK